MRSWWIPLLAFACSTKREPAPSPTTPPAAGKAEPSRAPVADALSLDAPLDDAATDAAPTGAATDAARTEAATDAAPTGAATDAAPTEAAAQRPPMDWTDLPKTCKPLDDELWDHLEMHKVKRVSGYAWIADKKLTIQLADYLLEPTAAFAQPQGEQRVATLITKATRARHRGTDDTMIVSYAHGTRAWNPWTTDEYVIAITHLDKTWVCGALEVPDKPDKRGRAIPQRFAARIVAPR